MAVTSILEIDVQDDKFQKARTELDEFHAKMKEINAMGKNMLAPGVAANDPQMKEVKKLQKEFKDQGAALKMISGSVGALTGTMRSVFGAVSGTAKLLMKWSGIVGLFGGVAGSLSIMGLIKSAQNIKNTSYLTNSAQGMNPADLGRLQATYGRIGNVEGLISGITHEQSEMFSLAFSRMGMTQGQARGAKTEELIEKSLSYIESQKVLIGQIGAGQFLRVSGLDSMGYDVETVNRLLKDPSLHAGIRNASEENKEKLQLQDPDKWSRFAMNRDLGFQNIEVSMQNMIEPILKPLDDVLTTIWKKLSSHGAFFDGLVASAARGLEMLNKALQTGEWKPVFDAFKDMLKKTGQWIADELQDYFPRTLERVEKFGEAIERISDFIKKWIPESSPESPSGDYPAIPKESWPGWNSGGKLSQNEKYENLYHVYQIALAEGVPPDDAKNFSLLAQGESSGIPNAVNPEGAMGGYHAQGIFQVVPKPANIASFPGLNKDNWSDPDAQTKAMIAEYKRLGNSFDALQKRFEYKIPSGWTGKIKNYFDWKSIQQGTENAGEERKTGADRELDEKIKVEEAKIKIEEAKRMARQKKEAEDKAEHDRAHSMRPPLSYNSLPMDKGIRLDIRNSSTADISLQTIRTFSPA